MPTISGLRSPTKANRKPLAKVVQDRVVVGPELDRPAVCVDCFPPLGFYNLALAYSRKSQLEKAIAAYRKGDVPDAVEK